MEKCFTKLKKQHQKKKTSGSSILAVKSSGNMQLHTIEDNISSNLNSKDLTRFNNLNVKTKTYVQRTNTDCTEENLEAVEIEDSFEKNKNKNKSYLGKEFQSQLFRKESDISVIISDCNTDNIQINQNTTEVRSQNEIAEYDAGDYFDKNKNVEAMLDIIYGDTWRDNKDSVIPKSEIERKLCNLEMKPETSERYMPLLKPIETLSANGQYNIETVTSNIRTKLNLNDDNQLNNGESNAKNNHNLEIYSKNDKNEIKEDIGSIKYEIQMKLQGKIYQDAKRNEDGVNCSKLTELDTEVYENWDKEISQINNRTQQNEAFSKACDFLESLSANVPINNLDSPVRIFRKYYTQNRNKLVQKLLQIYNEEVFDNCIPMDTPIEWNDRLRGTAGTCQYRKITHSNGDVERKVKIVLSTKVLDSTDRLRDTLLHELCHAATWIVNCVSDGHGTYWKHWAFKAMSTFPNLPPIKRCHDYAVKTKFVYKCIQCSYSIGRHTKSLDIERKRCGYCYGKFEVLINKTNKNGTTKTVPVTPRKEPSAFSLFVKENYALYKSPSLKHGDIMKLLSEKFSKAKN